MARLLGVRASVDNVTFKRVATDQSVTQVTDLTPLPVEIKNATAATASGTIAGASQTVVLSSTDAIATIGVAISGNTGGSTLQFEATIDGTNWFAVEAQPLPNGTPVTSTTASSGQWQINTAGFSSVRVRCSAFVSGTTTVTIRGVDATAGVEIIGPLPPGSNTIGSVTIVEGGVPVTWAAPVAVAMTGASKTFVPADATRKALMMWNPVANAAAGIDIAGGTVVLANAIQLSPGLPPTVFSGGDVPLGIVTAIGTNTQNLYYQSGS